MSKRLESPQIRAVKLAARWAQRLQLPIGNRWEPALVRYMLAEYERTEQWGYVEAMMARQLGLSIEEA